MESAINIFKNLPETKEQVKDYTRLIKQSVLDGEVEPLQFAATVSALESLFKALKADHLIKDVILEEAEKYRSKSFEKGNAKFQVKEVGVKYNFKNCNDYEYEQHLIDLQTVKDNVKARETFLKTITPEIEVYGSDGIQLNPVIKTSTTQVVVILK